MKIIQTLKSNFVKNLSIYFLKILKIVAKISFDNLVERQNRVIHITASLLKERVIIRVRQP